MKSNYINRINNPIKNSENDNLRNQMLKEAIFRMKIHKLHPNTIEDIKNGIVNVSYANGILYWANDTEKSIISEFEKKYNVLVYHAIYSETEFGRLFSMLYISEYTEEWMYERENFEYGMVCARVVNLDDALCTETGIIGVQPRFGGLIRIA